MVQGQGPADSWLLVADEAWTNKAAIWASEEDGDAKMTKHALPAGALFALQAFFSARDHRDKYQAGQHELDAEWLLL
jgi:hypothetical protein